MPTKSIGRTQRSNNPDNPQKLADLVGGFRFQTTTHSCIDQVSTEAADCRTLHRDAFPSGKEQWVHPSQGLLKPLSTLRKANQSSIDDSKASVLASEWENFQRLASGRVGQHSMTSETQTAEKTLAVQFMVQFINLGLEILACLTMILMRSP
eukprot:CAMPEP_0114231666 /NCGR_PEP_ID=MMETSP0058-20121206/4178_1 /TAXON_ID=36894 /ORGANISM="Pyramimonas parkeae, CCMP726" /LENGTH=151 /DNA_ID=CAMNT_0001343055 /DNA_START=318 /DNA_END=774 /DNA_ORIENTATION=+